MLRGALKPGSNSRPFIFLTCIGTTMTFCLTCYNKQLMSRHVRLMRYVLSMIMHEEDAKEVFSYCLAGDHSGPDAKFVTHAAVAAFHLIQSVRCMFLSLYHLCKTLSWVLCELERQLACPYRREFPDCY